jgi:hypothetical protein
LGLESRPFFVDPAVFFVAQRLNTKLSPPDASGIKYIQEIKSTCAEKQEDPSSKFQYHKLQNHHLLC